MLTAAMPGMMGQGWIDDFKVMKVENGYLVTAGMMVDHDAMPGANDWLKEMMGNIMSAQDEFSDPLMADIKRQTEEAIPNIDVPKMPSQKIYKEFRYVYKTIEEVAKSMQLFFLRQEHI